MAIKISCSHWGMFDVDPFTMLLWTVPRITRPWFVQMVGV